MSPTLVFDSGLEMIGAGSCQDSFNNYRLRFLRDDEDCNSSAPVSIDGSVQIGDSTIVLCADYVKADPDTLGNTRAAFFVYEDSCSFNGVNFMRMCRKIEYEPVTLTHVGDRATVVKQVALQPGWVPSHLHAVAILERSAGAKQVYQAANLPRLPDIAFDLPVRQRSCPQGSSDLLFSGSVTNILAGTDVITLSIAQVPGWTSAVQVEGDPNWYSSLPITLATGASRNFTIRVSTDGERKIADDPFTLTSGSTGVSETTNLHIFNGSPAILLVDDDGDAIGYDEPDETIFLRGLDQAGLLEDLWDIPFGLDICAPAAAFMARYDAVIWETGYNFTPFNADRLSNLAQYLDGGGRLFLSSMDGLSSLTSPDPFVSSYLGVASWTVDTGAKIVTGVAQDPITNGMALPLTYPTQRKNRVDSLVPGPYAEVIFNSEMYAPAAVRVRPNATARVVFSTVPQNVISETDPDPDNSETVIARTVAWLLPSNPAGIDPLPVRRDVAFLVQPNPCRSWTSLSFQLGPVAAAGPVSLSLVDVTGRLVRNLVNGRLTPGLHEQIWDGLDGASRPAGAGVYFARLKCQGGVFTTRFTLLK